MCQPTAEVARLMVSLQVKSSGVVLNYALCQTMSNWVRHVQGSVMIFKRPFNIFNRMPRKGDLQVIEVME